MMWVIPEGRWGGERCGHDCSLPMWPWRCREGFLPYVATWVGAVNVAYITWGWRTKHFTCFPSFQSFIFKREVVNILRLTTTFIPVQLRLHWCAFLFTLEEEKTESLSTHSSTTKMRRKRTVSAVKLSCHSSIITFESTLYGSRLPEPHFGGKITVRRKRERCTALPKLH